MSKTIFPVGVLWLVWATPALACQFDTDCAVGSECVKERGAIYGICVGGMSPGNSFDDEPVYDPLDLDESFGNTCRSKLDCGVGNVCLKEPGSLRGVCVDG